jgi:outer membrane protein assembly factor BamB
VKHRVALAVIVLAIAPALSAQHWPSFRGSRAAGVADGRPVPAQWNGETSDNLLWKTPIPGLSISSPVVWGDRVFVTTAIGSDPKASLRHGLYGDVEPSNDLSRHSWRVIALDKSTGRVVWERIAHEGVPRSKRHPKSTQASPTPATDGRYVVAFFGSEGLYAYDLEGRPVWRKDLGILSAGWFYDPDYQWGVGSSPVIHDDLVILQCDVQRDSFIAAFRLTDGTEVWRTSRDEIPSWGTPTIVEQEGRAQVVANGTKSIRGYDVTTGKELWRLSGNSEITVPTPFAANGLIYVFSGYRGIQPMYAIRSGASGDITLRDGATTGEWVAWSRNRGGPYLPTPVVYGDYLYVCQNNGVLAVYNARTGEQLYQQRLGRRGGAFTASPVAADGKVFFTSEDGEVFVVKAGPTYELLATNPMGEVLMATPAISDGVIFVRGLEHLFAIGRRAGANMER